MFSLIDEIMALYLEVIGFRIHILEDFLSSRDKGEKKHSHYVTIIFGISIRSILSQQN